MRAYKQRWQDKDPLRWRAVEADRHLRATYGISLAERNALAAQQGGACAICRTPFAGSPPMLDHDHTTGALRGLLCRRCNIDLGGIERPGYLVAALAYLRRHGSADPLLFDELPAVDAAA